MAPLLYIERQRFNPKHNPFFAHADVQLFIARREGRTVGRISAQVDSEHIRYWHERAGMFGFFECEDDPEAARALLTAAEEFLRERGMEIARGPLPRHGVEFRDFGPRPELGIQSEMILVVLG